MTNIYVGNLPYSVQEEDLIEYFSQWGHAERATLVFDRETGRPRGFGFVEMDDPEAAQKAIAEAHGQNFHGRPLTVNEARPRGSGRSANTSGYAQKSPPSYYSSPATGSSHGYANHSPQSNRPAPPPRTADSAAPSSGGGYSNQIYR